MITKDIITYANIVKKDVLHTKDKCNGFARITLITQNTVINNAEKHINRKKRIII